MKFIQPKPDIEAVANLESLRESRLGENCTRRDLIEGLQTRGADIQRHTEAQRAHIALSLMETGVPLPATIYGLILDIVRSYDIMMTLTDLYQAIQGRGEVAPSADEQIRALLEGLALRPVADPELHAAVIHRFESMRRSLLDTDPNVFASMSGVTLS